MPFTPAVREQVLARVGISGPSGSGKTRGALDIATAIVEKHGGRIAFADTNHGQGKLYADRYAFDHDDLTDRSPEGYVAKIREAVVAKYTVLILDTVSHEWLYVLAEADKFSNWKDLTPRHNAFVAEVATAPLHVICTMRSKVKYSVEDVEEGGRKKQVISRLGVGPVQREGLEYEFDVFAYLDETHEGYWQNRCDALVGKHMECEAAAPIIVKWLAEGDPRPWTAPRDLAETVARLTNFVDDAAPWIKEAVLAANPAVTDWPESFAGLPQGIRVDAGTRLGAVLRSLEHLAADGLVPAGNDETQKAVRGAFKEAFGVDVAGPDPFAGPIPF